MFDNAKTTSDSDIGRCAISLSDSLSREWAMFDFLKIDRAKMHWLNTLALAETRYPINVGETPLILQLQKKATNSLRHYPVVLPVEIAGEYCVIELQHWPLEKHINHYVSSDLLAELPGAILLEILNEVYRPLVEITSASIAARIKLLPPNESLRALFDHCSLEFCLSCNDGVDNYGRLLCEKTMQPFIGSAMRRNTTQCHSVENLFSVQARCIIGAQYFTPKELQGLSIGDVLIYARKADKGSPSRLTLHVNNKHKYKARYSEEGITIMSEEEQHVITPPLQKSDIEELSVRLDFDIGDLALSVAELRDLKPGAVIELDKTKESLVTIRNNGRAIAEAELVEIEGLIGVRICKMAN